MTLVQLSLAFFLNQELVDPLLHVTFKNLKHFSPYFLASSMKIQRFYSSIGQKIDFWQAYLRYLLSGTVTFRAYYAKTRHATCAWFCQRTSHLIKVIISQIVTIWVYIIQQYKFDSKTIGSV